MIGPLFLGLLAITALSCKGKSSVHKADETDQPAASLIPSSPPAPAEPSKTDQKALITGPALLIQNMNGHDQANWEIANWPNKGVFSSTWQADNITFRNGIMIIELNKNSGQYPYASGEYRTLDDRYGNGCYEARMIPGQGTGVMAGSLFNYTGTFGKEGHHEVDIEFLGKKKGLVQFAYHTNGKHYDRPEQDHQYQLPFDPTQSYHNYGYRWEPNKLTYFVDGQAVKTYTNDIPSKPGKIMLNLWTGTEEVTGWLGSVYKENGTQAKIDWVKYTTLDKCGQSEQVVAPVAPTTPPSAAPSGKLTASLTGVNRGNHSSGDIPVSVNFQLKVAPASTSSIKLFFRTDREHAQGENAWTGPGSYKFTGNVWSGHKGCLGKPCGNKVTIPVILRAYNASRESLGEVNTSFTVAQIK
jgi:beta-glucanase (GH16 family)